MSNELATYLAVGGTVALIWGGILLGQAFLWWRERRRKDAE
jgi:hypothetical protein